MKCKKGNAMYNINADIYKIIAQILTIVIQFCIQVLST